MRLEVILLSDQVKKELSSEYTKKKECFASDSQGQLIHRHSLFNL